jgi:hypothetical protein
MRRESETKLVRQAMREQRKLLIAYRDPKGVRTESVSPGLSRWVFLSLGG